MAQTATEGRLYSARTITDRKVVSRNGERVGEIQDLVIDTSRGCISYAVLSYSGGFLNMNRKLFAIPWEAMEIDEAHRDIVLLVDEQRLKDSPGFDRDEWPTEPDPSFASEVRSYYGYGSPGGGQQGHDRGQQPETRGAGYGGEEQGRGEGSLRGGESYRESGAREQRDESERYGREPVDPNEPKRW